MTTTTPPPAPPPPPILDDRPTSFWRRRGVRAAWMILGSCFTIASLAWTTLNGVAVLAHEERVEELSWSAAGIDTIEIRNSAGDVRVTGADTDTIRLKADISRGLFDTDQDWHREGDRLVITTDCPEIVNHFCDVDQELVVPAGIAIEIVSHLGDTHLGNLDGDVTVFSEDARVELARLAGTLDVELRHGSLDATSITSRDVTLSADYGRLRMAFVEAPDSLVVDAQFGDVDITLPDDGTAYAVTSSSDFGEIDNQLRVDPNSRSRIDITVRFGHGTLNYG